jgi:hypothetical protein
MVDARFTPSISAPELLKMSGASLNLPNLGGVLKRLAIEKHWASNVIVKLSQEGHFGKLFQSLLLRRFVESDTSLWNYFGRTMHHEKPADLPSYIGTAVQNAHIDAALASTKANTPDQFYGVGASSYFAPTQLNLLKGVTNVPIAVVGQGPAGIILSHALYRFGFQNISVFDKNARQGGIWTRENVNGGSKNNPRHVNFLGRVTLEAAADVQKDGGKKVFNFLNTMREDTAPAATYLETEIVRIDPGNLEHEVEFKISNERARKLTFPIIVNCVGLGKPRDPNDPDRMATSNSSTEAGSRWQTQLKREQVHRKTHVFVGLGNSTAEMLRQIHDFEDEGNEVNYYVLTHYPKDSVFNPEQTVDGFRVFRDPARVLTDYQGDLPLSRHDYFRALRNGRIIFGVKKYLCKSKNIVAWGARNAEIFNQKYDYMHTLIGYGHDWDSVEPYGCRWDYDNHGVMCDFDGEMIQYQSDPEKRLYKGYFGFGSILENKHNPNATVIPGMNFRLGDLLFGIIMRATEHVLAGKQEA